MTIQECCASLDASAAKLKAASASLIATIGRLQDQRSQQRMRAALRSEPALLPARKRRGTWHLACGEIIQYPAATQTVRLRGNDPIHPSRDKPAASHRGSTSAYRGSHCLPILSPAGAYA